MTVQYFTGTLSVLNCATCGMPFGITADFEGRRREDHTGFYCPLGHVQSYSVASDKEREIARLKEEIRTTENSRAFHAERARHNAEAAETARRQAAAARGVVTKVKRRLGKGVCPCCNRYFRDLHHHMTGQHPDWSKGDNPA